MEPAVAPETGTSASRAHRQVVLAADACFGGFCVLMLATLLVGWWRGDFSWHSPAAMAVFLVANVVVSQISLRARRPLRVELLRAAAGVIVAPLAYAAIDGPLAPWWPGFLIMAAGGCTIVGFLTLGRRWGRALVAYYLVMYGAVALALPGRPDGYRLLATAALIAVVGAMWVELVALLAATVRAQEEHKVELAHTRAELEVARQIQTMLLPRAPALDRRRVVGRSRPAAEVGGDYYDLIQADGRAFLAVGDVAGHGLTSGLTMMMARASLVACLLSGRATSLVDIYRSLNRAFRDSLTRIDSSLYMTISILEVLGPRRYAAVGRHLPMLIYRASRGVVEEVEPTGQWLGLVNELAPESLPVTEVELEGGDVLVLYTDGIVEHADGREQFGLQRLKDLIGAHAAAGPDDLVDAVFAALDRFSAEQMDDMTILAVAHEAAA